jgi:hypothetical protein
MTDPAQIPPEAWNAFHEAVQKFGYGPHAIAAALAAWPNACTTLKGRATVHYNSLILPLTQEARDE